MAAFLLILILAVELIFLIGSCAKHSTKLSYARNRLLVNVGELALFGVLLIPGITDFGIRFIVLFWVLAIRAVVSGVAFAIRWKRHKSHDGTQTLHAGATAVKIAVNVVLLFAAFLPAFVFSGYQGLPTTGEYDVATTSEIYVDQSRTETFETDGSHREVPVQFWYPKNANGQTFPVVFFSHGAFGFRQSNESLCEELASHGYVVCSMDHPYHSFFTEDTDGALITVDPDFMQSAMASQGPSEQTNQEDVFNESQAWLQLREDDMNFVVDTVIEKSTNHEGGVYALVDTSEIGLIGHSLGGAASVALGRSRDDISAVVDLDGTMLSEQLAWDGRSYLINEDPYPVPLLAIDNEDHHAETAQEGSNYVNHVVLEHAVDGKETYFKGSAHMNFTDLPLFSPVLANMLGTGSIDAERCIVETNAIVLSYFDHYLKDGEPANIADCYE